MDSAINADGRRVSVEALRGLITYPDLWCPGYLLDGEACEAKAWVTAMSSTVKHPAFAAHHGPGCDHGSERSTDREGDAGRQVRQVPLGRVRKMRMTLSAPSSGPNGRRRPHDKDPGTRTARLRAEGGGGAAEAPRSTSFGTLLGDLRGSEVRLDDELELGSRIVTAASVIHHAGDPKPDKRGSDYILWGTIQRANTTEFEGVRLTLAGSRDGVGLLIDAKTLRRLGNPPVAELAGRDVIGFGTLKRSAKGPYLHAQDATVAFEPRIRKPRRVPGDL
ncbi:hypothetical protein [Pseudoclavibacter sp. VKM Ac-2888]|uniref:hypothetical protein n=1 Tax=Pseudoclavibacter sp. VKM Ac-2888 TaxID=2783830 RepID=UPI00188A2C37|nr:hypothetical protein [Pseudoclavibacter sp. VKM Ac-2888]MBF4549329.1 hypothetical protein [Pseudoclavibacter sp. VKM Ac-2888]